MKTSEIMAKTETGCCPKFNPKPWQNKTIKWKNKPFVKYRVKSFFHIPLNIGPVMKKACRQVDAANAADPAFMGLFDENSLWGSDAYLSVAKHIPGANNVKISGTFMTKVFEGPYYNAGKWAKEMTKYVESKNKKVKQLLFFYTVCPRCAKKYGKMHTVIFARV